MSETGDSTRSMPPSNTESNDDPTSRETKPKGTGSSGTSTAQEDKLKESDGAMNIFAKFLVDPDLEFGHSVIPWRNYDVFQDYATNFHSLQCFQTVYDAECPICQDIYNSTHPDAEPEPTVKLNSCVHIMGAKCLVHWISGHLNTKCPFCRVDIDLPMTKIFAARAADVRHYIFWLMSPDRGKVCAVLSALEDYKYKHLRRKMWVAMDLKHHKTAAKLRKRRDLWGENIVKRRTLDYLKAFLTRTRHRALRYGISSGKWLEYSMVIAASECLRYHMSDVMIIEFADLFTSFDYCHAVEEYARDKKFGPHSTYRAESIRDNRLAARGVVDGTPEAQLSYDFVRWSSAFPQLACALSGLKGQTEINAALGPDITW